MKCDIDYAELKELLIGKYQALELTLEQCFQLEHYVPKDENGNPIPLSDNVISLSDKEYAMELLTEGYLGNTNGRFFLVWRRKILEKYCHNRYWSKKECERLKATEDDEVCEYAFVCLGLNEDDTKVTDMFYAVSGGDIELRNDIRSLNKMVYPKK